MKFLKNKIDAAKSRVKKTAKTVSYADTPSLAALVEQNELDGVITETDVERRKAEFLELLAKEERAHRVKLAELRNEPIENRRSGDISIDSETKQIDIVSKAKAKIQLPPVSPRFEDDIPTQPRLEAAASPVAAPPVRETRPLSEDPSFTTSLVRPTESQTRADIGMQIGGEDFLKGSNASFKTPELTAQIPDDAPREDVTPPPPAPALKSAPVQTAPPAPMIAKKVHAENDPYADMNFSRPATAGSANVNELRLDVSRISSDIENGDALYRRAQQRVQGLMHFVEKAEVDFSLLERIEPENRRLKARNIMIGKELEETVRKTSLLEAELDEHRRRLSEVNVQYDTVNGNLAKAMKALSERDREIRQLTNDISAITLKLDREKTTTEVEIRENNVLRDRVVNLTSSLEDAKASRADTTKAVESLKIDLEDYRSAKERIEAEASDLRHTLDEAQRQNNQMKGEMVALHQDISTFKTQYEFNIISRDDRITMLESQIEDLARQLQIKEDIVSSAARDVTELRKTRTGGELERERLENIIDAQSMQLEQAQKQILESQSVMEEMDTRYRDVAAALSITQNRRAQQAPSRAPDIHPVMNRPAASAEVQADIPSDTRSPIKDDFGTRGHDPIEDHVMEYKLGLRNSLIPAELQNKLDNVSPRREQEQNDVKPAPRREDNYDTLDQETIEDRIMDYKLGLRKNIF